MPNLKRELKAAIGAWKASFGASDWRELPFTVSTSGPDLVLRVGGNDVRGRASALPLLCATYWAAATGSQHGPHLPSLSSANLKPFLDQVRVPLLQIAEHHLAAKESREAVLCARRAVVGEGLFAVGFIPPEKVAKAFLQDPIFDLPLQAELNDRMGLLRGLKVAAAEFARPGFTRKLGAVLLVSELADELRYNDPSRFFKHADPILGAASRSSEPYVRERALACFEQIAIRLLGTGVHVEASPVIDALLKAHVAAPSLLRLTACSAFAAGDLELGQARLREFEALAQAPGIQLGPIDLGYVSSPQVACTMTLVYAAELIVNRFSARGRKKSQAAAFRDSLERATALLDDADRELPKNSPERPALVRVRRKLKEL